VPVFILAGSVLGILSFLLGGMLVTAVTQSSGAALAVLIAAAADGVIPLDAAAVAIIGTNLGTTSTAVLAALKAPTSARRVALGHIAFNLVAAGVASGLSMHYARLWTSKTGRGSAHGRKPMNTVKSALARKSGALIHVRSGDMVVEALRQMRDNRVRSVVVIDDDVLVGIVTQGDCAIKVLLPGLDAKQTPVSQVMTRNPVTVAPHDGLEGCMTMMAARGFRHLPVLDAGRIVGVISIGDVVKEIIRDLERNVGDLTGYVMRDGPGG
jgi:CBS domain-containing protein